MSFTNAAFGLVVYGQREDAALLVPEHMITRKAVAGTPDECVELLRIVAQSGFTKVALMPMGDVESVLRLLATQVLPRL